MVRLIVKNAISKLVSFEKALIIVGVNKRFDLTASKEIVEACYSMPISREKEPGKKMLKTTIKVTFNIEDRTFESK